MNKAVRRTMMMASFAMLASVASAQQRTGAELKCNVGPVYATSPSSSGSGEFLKSLAGSAV
jgi:hypothetical protein